MHLHAPSIHYACPCDSVGGANTFENLPARPASPTKRASRQSVSPVKRPISTLRRAASDDRTDQSFNPHEPLSRYSLFSLDDLLFCDECNCIRCPKCWQEEIVNWYCPQCLFEVPSSVVRGDSNRCSRSCYQCPICTAALTIAAQEQQSPPNDVEDGLLKPPNSESVTSGRDSYILQCGHCSWSSLDIGVQLPRPTKITEQLNKMRKARLAPPTRRLDGQDEDNAEDEVVKDEPEMLQGKRVLDPDTAFESLTRFYKEQLDETGDGQIQYGSSPYNSPANLARIMSLYGGLNYSALKKSRERPQPMREARDKTEGFQPYQASDEDGSDDELLERLQRFGWGETTSIQQRCSAPNNFHARFIDQLWPVATPLRIRRGKRCSTCRQFLSRPEPKVSSFRYKIRLLAQNHVPRLALKPLSPKTQPFENPAFRLKPGKQEEIFLQSHVTQQYILTVRNPIFETVRISLATPTITPGRIESRVTILCPTFTVGPAGDVWDDALAHPTGARFNDGGRNAAMASLTGLADGGDRQPEAGKVWEKTRSSTSVILEVMPGVPKPVASISTHLGAGLDDDAEEANDDSDNVVAIPIFVRAEWETEGQSESGQAGTNGEKEVKELAYWSVLGLGRIVG
ncbi:hypothetical protein K431DRAFT_268948 [Polychaeton citri CBS 116435]|uniref:Dynactin subunit 4 n=1 Tax=Polychaeton citri CBS 116435 TaxID=1314669 RepID=A0A9P4QAN9_9PEZI|nr:hypothetical protein K431DRAFT_268948 [Polychaeton citri CBS 116435]